MAEERTVVEIRDLMSEVEDADLENIREAIIEYLGSNLVQASLIGRAFTVSSQSEREKFADWMTGLMDQVYRYAVVTGHIDLDDEEGDDVD